MTPITQSISLRILVVEDNYLDFLLLEESIRSSKIPVVEIQLVQTMKAAIELLRQSKPDIVFLDLFLPDSNGQNSFTQIEDYVNDSAVIILSGLSDTQKALEAIRAGAQDYLEKGEFDEKLLAKTITYSIERKRNIEKLREANERYSLVSKATNDLIWDWNLETGKIYRDEETAKKVYGVSSNKEVMHFKEFCKYLHPEDLEGLMKTINEIKQSKDKNFFEVEYKSLAEDGSYKFIYDRGYVVRNIDGKAIRIIGAAQDITERKMMEFKLKESELQHQKIIAEATIKGQEKERKQFGLELHDNINQILATSKLYLEYAMVTVPIKKETIMKSKELIMVAMEEIRILSRSLLPPAFEDYGLITAINELIDSISLAGNLKIEKKCDAFDESILQDDQKLTVYRIVQEQFNNIIKHAEAKNVSLVLRLMNSGNSKIVELSIKDDGKGFDTSCKRNGVGLRNIASRAELFGGTVSIQSEPGYGCELKITYPL